jgi:hypothetical protein
MPENIRMGTCEDLSTNNVYRFTTNNFELFHNNLRQHFRIKSFYVTSRNAVYWQIWIALSTYQLIAITKKRMHIEQSGYTFSQTLGLPFLEKYL